MSDVGNRSDSCDSVIFTAPYLFLGKMADKIDNSNNGLDWLK